MDDRVLPELGRGWRSAGFYLLDSHADLGVDLDVAASIGVTGAAFYALPEWEQEAHRSRYFSKALTHSCGFDRETCADPDHAFFVRRDICYADMKQAACDWQYDDQYGGKFHDGSFMRWAEERSAAFPYGHRDGVTLRLTETDEQPDATWHLPPEVLPIRGMHGARYVTPEPSSEGGDPRGNEA